MPRAWEDLTLWGQEHDVAGCELRNMLAWLEDAGMARAFVRGGVHGWRRSVPRVMHLLSPIVAYDRGH